MKDSETSQDHLAAHVTGQPRSRQQTGREDPLAPEDPVILLVDDEAAVLSALRRLLRNGPYRMITADSGHAALDILRSTTVDLLISDMRMPHMSGAELLAQVRVLYPDTMRILLTGYAEIDSMVRAINDGGVYRYLNKPWDEQDLLSTIRQALEQKRLTRESARLTKLTQAQNEELLELNAALEALLSERTADLKHLERHDILTGLCNRSELSRRLDATVRHAKSGTRAYAVLAVGLKRFKEVNDLYGHRFGDFVLLEVVRRLKAAVRSDDMVSRLSGDEFAIIAGFDRQTYADGASRLATRLLDSIRHPIAGHGQSVEIDASIGIALLPLERGDSEELLRAAEIAMNRAKCATGGAFRFFEARMDEELRRRAELERDVRMAVRRAEIVPHYQPLVDIQHDRIFGFEILARWHSATHGWVAPDVFIPVVERLGLIQELTTGLLRRACQDAAAWPGEPVRLSLNITPAQLNDPRLPSALTAILDKERFPARRLEVEVTETALVGDTAIAKAVLQTLADGGTKIALDDFGTGYSSLYHLRELRFDKLKIDRSFVQSMRGGSESERIVDAILGMSRSLCMQTIAEGIEDQWTLDRLRAKGCQFGQGFHLGRPMSAKDTATLLESGSLNRTPV